MRASTRIWFFGVPLLCALGPLVCAPVLDWMAVAPHGSEVFMWFELLLVIPALAAVLGCFVALFGLIFRSVRRHSAFLVLCSVAYLVGFVIALPLGQSVRMSAFHRLAERSKPLIAAIHSSEQKYGRPPESLQALVPEFIPSVPTTGIGAYPEYRYSAPGYNGNPWVITVYTGYGMNFDQFMYFPLTNYPERGYGGWLERIGDWAYVHE